MRCPPQISLLLAAALAAAALAGCGGGDGSASSTTAKAPVPAAKAAAPGVPASPHGDNSIQTWGLEASAAQRAEASAIVRSYLSARAARRWARACSYLAAKQRAEQRRFARGLSCAKAMGAFAAGAPTAALRREARIEALSLRAGGGYAFLIYRRPGAGVYASALSGKAGNWKVVSVTPERLR